MSPFLELVQVSPGFDVADNEIVKRAGSGDLVITADIPLAAEVMENGAHALTPRGELYSTETIRQRLNMRDFMDTLRASGIHTRRPAGVEQERPAVVCQPSGQDVDQVRERLSYPLSGAAAGICESRFMAVAASAAAGWCNLRATRPVSPRAGCRWQRQWPG